MQLYSHTGFAIGLVQRPQIKVLQIGKCKQAAIATREVGDKSAFLHISGVRQ